MPGIRDQGSGIRDQGSGIRDQKFMGASRRGRRENHATPNILAAAKPPVTSSDT
ncbi:MAG: hypothetical protein LBI62_09525 [Candidatus Accumulibacter sp.]|jgi:hypothetical protein|nr:hypothetical protein [Accumulibacter sp.]